MKAFPESLLDEPEERAARFVALALLEDAAAECLRLASSADPEALHDFRVAVRRLRSWLRAQRPVLADGAPRRALEALRRVAQATNVARDSEVFSAWLAAQRETLAPRKRVGVSWLRTRADDRQVVAGRGADATVASGFAKARDLLAERLPWFRLVHHLAQGPTGVKFGVGMAALVRRDLSTLERRLAQVHDASSAEQAHRARIAGKRLRYLLEPILPCLPGGGSILQRLKDLQDTLGDLHDAHVWMEHLREALEELGREEGRLARTVARVDGDPSLDAAPRRADVRPGVMAVTQLVRARARDAFQAFEATWRGEPGQAFLADVAAAADALQRRHAADVEIERKYLLSSLPGNWPAADTVLLEQGYLPGERLVERLRHERTAGGERFLRTVKLGTGLVRTEVEEEATREVFDAMWPLTLGRRVCKRRHRVPDGALTWEIDEFTDRDLVLAEVELPDAGTTVTVPEWLAPYVVREVTGEAEYVNANLAR